MINYRAGGGAAAAARFEFSTIGQYFSQQALEAERYFKTVAASSSRRAEFLPKTYCGYECEVRKRATLQCVNSYDCNAVVSLAVFEKKSILSSYANKTAIMCINVNRFMYTVDAFRFANKFEDPVSEALDFFIMTDIQRIEAQQNDSISEIPPNLAFSNLLHSLKSSGYEKYIFALAKRLDLDVDLVVCQSGPSSDPIKTLFRYKRIDDAVSNRGNKIGAAISIGMITAVNNGDQWFVKVTKSPIIE